MCVCVCVCVCAGYCLRGCEAGNFPNKSALTTDFPVLAHLPSPSPSPSLAPVRVSNTMITSDIAATSSSSSQLNPSLRIICRVCQKQFSQYTCPRCNTRYCSLQCYKSHSIRCTESFMRDNVVDELRQLQPDDETKQKMLDILKRFHSEEDMDAMDEDDSSLSEGTIHKILSGSEFSFDDLTVEEKKHFQRAVASGELSKLIEPWDPWWLKPTAKTILLSPDGTQLVRPLVEEKAGTSLHDVAVSDQFQDIPPGPESPLPSVSKLSSAEPSPLLAVHLVDITFTYCFTLRLYNGDWKADVVGSAMVILSISSILGQGGQPETVSEALAHCLEQTCSPAFRQLGGLQYAVGLMDDVICLLSLGGAALVCMLCHLHGLIQAAERELKSEKLQKSKKVEIKGKLKAAARKIYFMMCWVHEQPAEACSSLATMVNVEKCSIIEYGGNKGNTLRTENKMERRGRPLIEEVK